MCTCAEMIFYGRFGFKICLNFVRQSNVDSKHPNGSKSPLPANTLRTKN